MKKIKNHREFNFSQQFDNLTLKDIINTKQEKPYDNKEYYEKKGRDGTVYLCSRLKGIGENFRHLKPVKTNRFIWHVSGPKNRLSILEKGLIPRESDGGLWANNYHNIGVFYPFAIDGDYIPYDHFDFWRIDTHKAKVEWREDPNMYDVTPNPLNRCRYVCTYKPIAASAIKLYQFEPTCYVDEWQKYWEVYAETLHVRNLKPVTKYL